MLNALTIDLEDYFQVQAFANVVKSEDWDNYESRIERNTHRLLDMLHECKPNFLSNVTNCLPHSLVNSINSSNPINPSNSSNSSSVLSPQGSELSPCVSRPSMEESGVLPQTSNLKPEALNSSPPTSNLQPLTSVRATFFCLGWVADRYPHLVREIHRMGHEIACHGYSHKLIYTQTKEQFREDIKKAKAILEDITGDEVIGYRAPSYSITNKSQWAFEVLMNEGFRYDSSIFPIHHDFYGFPEAPRFPFLISMNGNSSFEFHMLDLEFAIKEPQHSSTAARQHFNNEAPQHNVTPNLTPCASRLAPHGTLIEFPLTTVRVLGANLPVAGGGYFRLFPYSLVKRGLKRINEVEKKPFIFYLHPWELDPDQPRMNSISRKSRFRHYVNLHKTESRFKRLLQDFRFSSIKDLLQVARREGASG